MSQTSVLRVSAHVWKSCLAGHLTTELYRESIDMSLAASFLGMVLYASHAGHSCSFYLHKMAPYVLLNAVVPSD